MRVVDLIRELPSPPTRVIDRTPGTFKLPGVETIRDVVDDDVVAGDLIVVAIGPNGPAYSDIDDGLDKIGSLPAGAHVLVLTAAAADEMPVPAILEWCTRLPASVILAAPLSYRWFRAGVMLRVDGEDRSRLANEIQLTRVAWQGKSSKSHKLQIQLASARRQIESSAAIDPSELVAARRATVQLEEAVARLSRRIVELESEVGERQVDLARVTSSTSFQLGSALTKAARPSRDTVALGRRLVRLWGKRGAWRDGIAVAPAGQHPSEGPHPDGRLLHVFRQFGPLDGRPVVAGILSRRTVCGFDGSVLTVPLWPNDACAIFDRIEPAVIVIESSATSPGEIWNGLGQSAGAHLEEALGELLSSARRRAVPILFWWTSPASAAPGLRKIASRCDAVGSDPTVIGVPQALPLQPGVPLRSLQPRGPETPPTGRPLLHTSVDRSPVGSVEAAVRQAAIERGLEIRFDPDHRVDRSAIVAPEDRLQRYSQTPWAIAEPFSANASDWSPIRTLTLAASGAAIIGGPGALPPNLSDHLVTVISSTNAREAIAMADARPPWTAQMCRNALGECWRIGRWEDLLATLLEGIGADTQSLRSIAACSVRARPTSEQHLDKLAADVLGQTTRPATVILEETRNDGIEWFIAELEREHVSVCNHDVRGAGPVVNWNPAVAWSPQHLAVLAASHRVVNGTVETPQGDWLVRAGRSPKNEGMTPWWLDESGWL